MDDLAHRIDRLESTDAIRQLVSRYGVLLDKRDLDAVTQLFVEDTRVTRTERGHEALRALLERPTGPDKTRWPINGPDTVPQVYETWRAFWAEPEE